MSENNIIREDFNRIAKLGEKQWDHNRHYHRYLGKHIPEHCEDALDIGCGIGEFSRLLAARSKQVTGLDLAPGMLEQAKERSKNYTNIGTAYRM